MTIEIASNVGPARIDIAYARLGDPGAAVLHHGAHVGGYTNTGWDLVANTIGVALALRFIARRTRVATERLTVDAI